MLAFLCEGPTMAKKRRLLYFSFCVISSNWNIFKHNRTEHELWGGRKRRKGSQSARRDDDSSGVLCSLVLWGLKNAFNQWDVATVQKRREKSMSGLDRPETKNKGHFEFWDSHHNWKLCSGQVTGKSVSWVREMLPWRIRGSFPF